MPPPSISFRLVPNVRQGSGRAVGMLGGHQDLCANTLINLKEKDAKYMRYSMDRWSSGIDGPNARCHPFPGTDYFVFKQVAEGHRFYGYLYHPLPKTNPRFLLCVLTTYAQKREDKTDPADLGRVKQWMNAPASKAAISVVYADKEPEKKG